MGVCSKHTPKSPLKKTSLKSSPKPKSTANLEKRNEFFMKIWSQRPFICQHCGISLGPEPRSYMFDHILEKSKYPQFTYEAENIWLTCLECHDEKTRGIISEKYQKKINFVLTKFNLL